jgi:hypothetical protein
LDFTAWWPGADWSGGDHLFPTFGIFVFFNHVLYTARITYTLATKVGGEPSA